jgi:hypothetical protein
MNASTIKTHSSLSTEVETFATRHLSSLTLRKLVASAVETSIVALGQGIESDPALDPSGIDMSKCRINRARAGKTSAENDQEHQEEGGGGA